MPGITSLATSLGCVRVTPQTYDYAQRENVRSVVLSDAEAAMGCWRLADDERTMVELACGVNVALCYDGRLEEALGRKVRPEDKVVIVLCGGSNVTFDMLAKWREEYGWVEQMIKPSKGDVPSEVTKPVAKDCRWWEKNAKSGSESESETAAWSLSGGDKGWKAKL